MQGSGQLPGESAARGTDGASAGTAPTAAPSVASAGTATTAAPSVASAGTAPTAAPSVATDPTVGPTPVSATDATVAPGVAGSDAASRPGGASARYVPNAVLGRGGMGEVTRAWDRELERAVALKRLLPAVVRDPGLRARFWAEATLTAGLEHPGIIPVYDRGSDADGALW